MSMSLFRGADTDGGVFSPATTTRPKWPQTELPELEFTLRAAIMNMMAEASRPVTEPGALPLTALRPRVLTDLPPGNDPSSAQEPSS